jgi:hypothetical protein
MSEPVPGRGGGWVGHTVGEVLPATCTVMRKRDGADCSWVQFFLFGGPSSSARSGGAISGTGCMAHQLFATRGTRPRQIARRL